MVFKRRTAPSTGQKLRSLVYPRGGWWRAAGYVLHRLRRLPDAPERIAVGVGAGIFASFTPLFGFHFFLAATVAWIFRGNIFASLLSTFFGNPVTFPIIVVSSIELGSLLLGLDRTMTAPEVMKAFGAASAEVTANLGALISDKPVYWGHFLRFLYQVFLPYLLGGVILGTVVGVIGYFASLPVIRAYQARRRARLRARFELARRQDAARAAEVAGKTEKPD
ncbi:DUF2062 domain-containing protein [Rhodobacteraceae bacterium 2376]|uniref:DUF2062 domain-containing protein n=1 Tax=Rhabdonatronobacter sediminivivens TaxID=2743469 RepID=A0A7Z0HXU6_9RHOB|nr:DUF2062 domain-containing protein [Rhabdonatronobacter sediminivivens]NYS24175.1 DUF2062 domain-containing protein [Rhabdonatronobacter sediminivivens]